MSHQIHTYTELRQQIHDDLPIQHPEWVEPNGGSLMWLTKLLDSLTQTGIQRVYRYSSSRLRTGTKLNRHSGCVIRQEVALKLPAHVLFRKDLSLMLWKPHGILDEVIVNEIVAFIDVAEERASKPFNRFADLSALDMVDLNFKFVFHIGLHRRLASAPHSPVKSAFYVTSPATAYYAKLHAMLTDYSTLDVALFTEREAAAKWLSVPVEVLMAQ